MPTVVAEGAAVGVVFVGEAGATAGGTEGAGVEPVAVAVKAIFGEIVVPNYAVARTEAFGFFPGKRFDLEEFDVFFVVVLLYEVMTDLV